MPIDPKGRQHCWHATSVDMDVGVGLVLQPLPGEDKVLQITAIPLAELLGCTMELIGTHINGNPYQLGSKQAPLHLLVRHGAIPFQRNPPINFSDLKSWFHGESDGQIEGIVWHCSGGNLFKVHRHHLGLKWPVEKTRLQAWQVKIDVDVSKFAEDLDPTSLFHILGKIGDLRFDSIGHIPLNKV